MEQLGPTNDAVDQIGMTLILILNHIVAGAREKEKDTETKKEQHQRRAREERSSSLCCCRVRFAAAARTDKMSNIIVAY